MVWRCVGWLRIAFTSTSVSYWRHCRLGFTHWQWNCFELSQHSFWIVFVIIRWHSVLMMLTRAGTKPRLANCCHGISPLTTDSEIAWPPTEQEHHVLPVAGADGKEGGGQRKRRNAKVQTDWHTNLRTLFQTQLPLFGLTNPEFILTAIRVTRRSVFWHPGIAETLEGPTIKPEYTNLGF